MWRWIRAIFSGEGRDAAASERLWAVRARCVANPRLVLVHVVEVYQEARDGSKATVIHDDTGRAQDTWFEGMRPVLGSSYLVQRCDEWGEHNRNPHVLYVHRVYAWLPPGTWQAAYRHDQRAQKSAPAA